MREGGREGEREMEIEIKSERERQRQRHRDRDREIVEEKMERKRDGIGGKEL